METTIKDRAYKLSFIANPSNGAGFFQILYKLDWDSKGLVVTEDKLQMIASSSVGPSKYVFINLEYIFCIFVIYAESFTNAWFVL